MPTIVEATPLPAEADAHKINDLLQAGFEAAEDSLAAFDHDVDPLVSLADIGALGLLRELFTTQMLQLEYMRDRIDREHRRLVLAYHDQQTQANARSRDGSSHG